MNNQLTDRAASALTERAFELVVERLENFGNFLSEPHRKALHGILEAFSQMAQGELEGRWAFGLAAGLGKSSCAVAWIAAMIELGFDDRLSIAVAAEEINALENLWAALETLHVDMSKIGMRHSKETTEDYLSKPVLLICHARVRTKFLGEFGNINGSPRSLLVWDESLIATYSLPYKASVLDEFSGAMARRCQNDPEHRNKWGECSAYLDKLDTATYAEINRLKGISSTQSVIQWPQIDEDTLERFKELDLDNQTLQDLLSMAPYPVKITRLDGSGAVQYQTSVPSALTNVIVLDASEPIRDLERYDRMMRSAEDSLPSMSVQSLGAPLSRIKRHDNVTIFQMQIGSGKHTMRQSFAKTKRDERLVIKEVIHALQNHVSEDEGVSIIVFKPTSDKFGKRVDFKKVLENDLENAGFDLTATIPVSINGKVVRKPRICVTTWGKHTATNDWSYCTTQFQIGILHRDTLDLMGNAAGQMGNLNVELSHKLLLDLQLSEVAHCSYQAMNRINCRHVENGQAKAATIWLFHDNDNLRQKLETVLEGAQWLDWRKHYTHPEKRLRTYTAPTTKATMETVLKYLKGLPEGESKVSFKRIKDRTGLTGLNYKTFTKAIDQVVFGGINGWVRDGRGLLRGKSLFAEAI